jgi:hypothetical protein
MLQLEGSVRVSQRPAMVLPSSLDVPVKRCEKVKRREVGRLSHQRPDALAQGHRMFAYNASRVEVVLGVRPAVKVEADDCQLSAGSSGNSSCWANRLSAKYPLEIRHARPRHARLYESGVASGNEAR